MGLPETRFYLTQRTSLSTPATLQTNCKCVVGRHPLKADIDDALKARESYGTIRDFIVDKGETPPEKYELSRHGLKCLGLEPRSAGRPKKVLSSEDVPELKSVRDLAISLLYDRMRNNPSDIASRELAQFVIQAMKNDNPDNHNDADAVLEQLGRGNTQSRT